MNNVLNLVRIFRNPEPFMKQIMNSPQYKNNQVAKEMTDNVMDMRSKNDVQGLTKMAKNVCGERGIDFDSLYSQLKKHR